MEPRDEIYQNAAIQDSTGRILVSTHRHDFVAIYDDEGKLIYAVDGGTAYIRRCDNGNSGYRDISIFSSTPYQEAVENALWGVLNPDGKTHTYKFMKDLTPDHLRAILRTQNIPTWRQAVINILLAEEPVE